MNKKTQLNLLYLDGNGITCEGAKQLAKVNHIYSINLIKKYITHI